MKEHMKSLPFENKWEILQKTKEFLAGIEIGEWVTNAESKKVFIERLGKLGAL